MWYLVHIDTRPRLLSTQSYLKLTTDIDCFSLFSSLHLNFFLFLTKYLFFMEHLIFSPADWSHQQPLPNLDRNWGTAHTGQNWFPTRQQAYYLWLKKAPVQITLKEGTWYCCIWPLYYLRMKKIWSRIAQDRRNHTPGALICVAPPSQCARTPVMLSQRRRKTPL